MSRSTYHALVWPPCWCPTTLSIIVPSLLARDAYKWQQDLQLMAGGASSNRNVPQDLQVPVVDFESHETKNILWGMGLD